MNVERLEKLAETIKPGFHKFDDNLCVKFDMSCFFSSVGIRRHDGCTHDACLIGFTILLFGDRSLLLQPPAGYETLNWDAEATNLLDLPDDHSHELFYGSLSNKTSGEDVSRVIRKFLITGHVDWSILDHGRA